MSEIKEEKENEEQENMEELKPAIWFPEYLKFENMALIENGEITIDFKNIKVSYV